MSDFLQPHGLQHTRLPCPSPTPRACSNSCPSSWWSHPTTSSSVVLFSSRLQPFPASGSFPMSQFFTSGGQSILASASASVLSVISFRIDWFNLLAVQGTLKSFLQHHSPKASILHCSAFFMVQFSHPYMTTGKIIALTRWTFVSKIMSLLFIVLSRFVMTSLVAQMVRSLSAMWESWVRSLGWEEPLEKEMATHSSILAWKIPWTEECGSPWCCRVRHNWETSLSFRFVIAFILRSKRLLISRLHGQWFWSPRK